MVAIVTIYDEGLIRAMATDGANWNQKVAYEVMAEAMINCPGKSGALKASHRVEQNRSNGAFASGFNVSAGNGLDDARALWVHEGTGKYGPRGTAIVPFNNKYLSVPPGMGFRWSLSYKLATPRKRKKGVRGPYVRTLDPNDPYYHAESVDGQRGHPWLRWAGEEVGWRHGAV